MQFRRFLGNFAKTYLAIGALSVSAFAGADDFHNFNHQGFNDHNSYSSHNSYGSSDCSPGASCGSCETSCCGFPCNPAPDLGWAYNPPAYARCGCDTSACSNSFLDSFAFRADFLWWRACEEGLSLGTEEFIEETDGPVSPSRSTVVNRSHSKHPNFKYDPGFRIGISNYCSCDCWDFAVNWTHFHTKAKVNGATSDDGSIVFFSDWERIVGANPRVAGGRYALNLDLVDIEFGRKFYVSNCFVLRPDFGLRVARIHQTYRVASEAVNGDGDVENFISDVKSRSNFLAVGPRVGLDVELHFCGGFALFGQAAGSIVFGKFDNHSRENYLDTVSSAPVVGALTYEARSSAHRCSRTITDLAFGIKWDHCYEWCNRCHPVSIAFAWEHHAFYDMNNFNFVENGLELEGPSAVATGAHTRKHGDLNTQGLTVSIAFGF